MWTGKDSASEQSFSRETSASEYWCSSAVVRWGYISLATKSICPSLVVTSTRMWE